MTMTKKKMTTDKPVWETKPWYELTDKEYEQYLDYQQSQPDKELSEEEELDELADGGYFYDDYDD